MVENLLLHLHFLGARLPPRPPRPHADPPETSSMEGKDDGRHGIASVGMRDSLLYGWREPVDVS